MGHKQKRVIGTTPEFISRAETEIGRSFPPSFREWLLKNNGLSLDGVSIFLVLDDRDIRKTWDSIVRLYDNGNWFPDYFDPEVSGEFLLPFGDYGTGDYYCFDYSQRGEDGEVPVVWMSHETGECEPEANTFAEFVEKIKLGVLED